jgi:hypothetical protein
MPLPRAVANSITQVGLRAIVIMFAIWLLLMLISLYHDGRAHAHDAQHLSDWIGNQSYKSPNGEACCGLGDCAMLDDDAVQPIPGGYAVHGSGTYFLPYGPRDIRRERFDETVPASETLVSQNNHYWRCGTYYGGFIVPNERRCFFIKPSFSEIPLGRRGAS